MTQALASDEVTMEDLMKEIKALKKRIVELGKICEKQDKMMKEDHAKWEEARQKFEHLDAHILHKEEEAGYTLGKGFKNWRRCHICCSGGDKTKYRAE